MALVNHDCDRFRALGLSCPFRRFKEDDEQPEEAKRPVPAKEREEEEAAREGVGVEFLAPGRRREDRRQRGYGQGQELSELVIAHGDPVMAKELERIHAFKQKGGLPSIPSFPQLNSPLSEQGMAAIIAALTGIAIMQALRSMQATGSAPSFQQVQGSERHASKGLSKVSDSLGRGSARSAGRGGLHVNAARDLRNLLRPRKLLDGGPTAGFDSFSETGFN